jgi:hypothetical protein
MSVIDHRAALAEPVAGGGFSAGVRATDRRVSRILLTADPFFPVPPPLYGGIQRIVASLCNE